VLGKIIAAKQNTRNKVRVRPAATKQAQRALAQVRKEISVGEAAGALGKMAIRKGGNYLGGLVAGPLGASIGDWITGNGDYTVNSNSLLGGNQIPVFREGKRSIIVKHREYLTDIQSSVGFSLASFALNPGLTASFPWLSSVAGNFEQCRWHGLVFEFRSTSGSAIASTNNALGSVIQSTEYNVNKPNFTSKQQMEAYEFSCSAKPSESFIHPIECNAQETQTGIFNVRQGPVVGQELRMYDIGNYQIATLGMQASGIAIGELWVSYEIEFLKPVLPLSLYDGFSARLAGGAYTSTNYYGTIVPVMTGSFIPTISATGAGYDTVTFPASVLTGNFVINVIWRGTAAACTTPTVTLTNGVALPKLNLGALTQISNGATTSGTFLLTVCCQVSNPAGVAPFKFVLTGGALPGSGASVDLLITQVSDSF